MDKQICTKPVGVYRMIMISGEISYHIITVTEGVVTVLSENRSFKDWEFGALYENSQYNFKSLKIHGLWKNATLKSIYSGFMTEKSFKTN